MKKLIVAVSFAVLSTSVLATGMPFEQVDLDRQMPNIPESRKTGVDYPFGGTAPYDQLVVDLALPNVDVRGDSSLVAAGGNTRSDVELSAAEGSAWSNDHNFIAPAQ